MVKMQIRLVIFKDGRNDNNGKCNSILWRCHFYKTWVSCRGGSTMLELIKAWIYGYKIVNDEEGQGLVEYALIIAVIAIMIIAGLQFVRGGINNAFTDIGTNLNAPK
jgi:pilus assembly protein Flp/PilA